MCRSRSCQGLCDNEGASKCVLGGFVKELQSKLLKLPRFQSAVAGKQRTSPQLRTKNKMDCSARLLRLTCGILLCSEYGPQKGAEESMSTRVIKTSCTWP